MPLPDKYYSDYETGRPEFPIPKEIVPVKWTDFNETQQQIMRAYWANLRESLDTWVTVDKLFCHYGGTLHDLGETLQAGLPAVRKAMGESPETCDEALLGIMAFSPAWNDATRAACWIHDWWPEGVAALKSFRAGLAGR